MSARQPHELLLAAQQSAPAAPVEIAGVELAPIEYEGVRVMTLAMIDKVHQRPDGTAGRNFRENRARFIEGEDYQKVCADEIRTHKICEISNKAHEDVILMTETGYSMLVKSFTDDLAWDVQRQLVKSYFAKPVLVPTAPASRQVDEATRALKMVPLAMRAAKAFGFDQNAAAISVNQYVRAVTGQNLLESFGSTHLQAENQETQWFTPSELSAQAKMPAKDLNLLLASAGFQKKRGKKWELIDAGRPFARIFDVGKQQGTGVPIQQLKWSPAVIDAARKASKSTEPPPGSQQQLGLDPA